MSNYLIMLVISGLVLIFSSIVLIHLFVRKNTMECFYVENEILCLNSLPTKSIPLSEITRVEFFLSPIRMGYKGQIKVHMKNAKIVKRYFQTSKIAFYPTTKTMVLDEIAKLTPFLDKHSIPYTIQQNYIKTWEYLRYYYLCLFYFVLIFLLRHLEGK